jgi:hypothetical protein
MSKKAISVTIEADNLLWLKARTRATGSRSISAVLDDMVTGVRKAAGPVTSIVGWVSFPEGEAGLRRGKKDIRELFDRSLAVRPTRRQRRG